MKTCRVNHFRKSYALAMEFSYQNGDKNEMFKLAYSGDTGLCDAFVKLGHEADLLIHEATFQNELNDSAINTRHSTISMALQQSKRMRAKFTILTHFSSRYHILPYITEKLDKTGIAFDYMEVTLDDLPKIESLYEEYKNAFPGITQKLKQKTKNYLINSGWEGPMHFE